MIRDFKVATAAPDGKDPRNADRLRVVLALAAALFGAYLGWIACADVAEPASRVFMSHLMTAIFGAISSLALLMEIIDR